LDEIVFFLLLGIAFVALYVWMRRRQARREQLAQRDMRISGEAHILRGFAEDPGSRISKGKG
jgi:hypothetical protein